ncbi:hypothetical protein [Galbibacter sp. PAP.153]|uniref:hypothetical protein n=1 Tax=Galbibacter sp. PAP.153 TaxID=3104623 RepID=UPI0030091370
MTIVIIIIVIIFLYWSLVPARPKQHNLNDIINQTQKNEGKFSNVYLDYEFSQTFGKTYYVSKSPNDLRDKKVFSGTENECENYVFQHNP